MSYDMIDRFLRNNLGDDDYAEYSAALDSLCAPQRTPLTVEEVKNLIHPIVMADLSDEMTDFEIVRAVEAAHGIKGNA